jgi:hypothetical protein
MALVKYNNNSISAVTAASSLPTGAMTLIKEQTASASGTIDFVDGTADVVLDSTYPIYLFKFINMHPGTDDTFFTFNLSVDTGSNYNVTKTTTFFNAEHREDGGDNNFDYQALRDLAQSTAFQNISRQMGNNSDDSCSGYLHLFNPSSTTFVKHFISTVNDARKSANPYSQHCFMAGYGNTTSAVDAIQFKQSSGNIDAGTIKLYGIKDS